MKETPLAKAYKEALEYIDILENVVYDQIAITEPLQAKNVALRAELNAKNG